MGREHAHTLAAAGIRVGIIDVDAESASIVEREIRGLGHSAQAIRGDVTNLDEMNDVADSLERALGPVSIVIANAGVISTTTTEVVHTNYSDWRRSIDVNLTGAFITAKVALPRIGFRGGVLIFIASTAALAGFPDYGPYVAAKHGVVGLMRCISAEKSNRNVRTYAICPGAVNTPILAREAASLGIELEELVKQQVENRLLKRLIEPREISQIIMFLIGDIAGALNGNVVVADAGLLAKR
jgi:NAD(P)-dependent dehydrogenase (short-subunit alcohol dehydrogenase family)